MAIHVEPLFSTIFVTLVSKILNEQQSGFHFEDFLAKLQHFSKLDSTEIISQIQIHFLVNFDYHLFDIFNSFFR